MGKPTESKATTRRTIRVPDNVWAEMGQLGAEHGSRTAYLIALHETHRDREARRTKRRKRRTA